MLEKSPKIDNSRNSKPKNILVIVVVLIALIIVVFSFFNKKELRFIAISEIANHKTASSCWTTVNGDVYDVTKFISKHKGGEKILAVCGIDGTDLFTGKSPMGRVHSKVAFKLLSSMKIGTLQK